MNCDPFESLDILLTHDLENHPNVNFSFAVRSYQAQVSLEIYCALLASIDTFPTMKWLQAFMKVLKKHLGPTRYQPFLDKMFSLRMTFSPQNGVTTSLQVTF